MGKCERAGKEHKAAKLQAQLVHCRASVSSEVSGADVAKTASARLSAQRAKEVREARERSAICGTMNARSAVLSIGSFVTLAKPSIVISTVSNIVTMEIGDEEFEIVISDALLVLLLTESATEYHVQSDRMDWQQHEDAAVAWGGHLTSITSEDELVKIKDLCIGAECWIGAIRIGLGDGPGPEHWKWADGSPWEYTDWQARGRYLNNSDYGQDRVRMCGRHGIGVWAERRAHDRDGIGVYKRDARPWDLLVLSKEPGCVKLVELLLEKAPSILGPPALRIAVQKRAFELIAQLFENTQQIDSTDAKDDLLADDAYLWTAFVLDDFARDAVACFAEVDADLKAAMLCNATILEGIREKAHRAVSRLLDAGAILVDGESVLVDELKQIGVGHVLSWSEYRDRAANEGGRLPTTAELRAEGIEVEYDQYTPITASDRDIAGQTVENAWANIGPRKYQIELFPEWGLNRDSCEWKKLTYFYVIRPAWGAFVPAYCKDNAAAIDSSTDQQLTTSPVEKLVEQDSRLGPRAVVSALECDCFDLAERLICDLHVAVAGMVKDELLKPRGKTTLWHQIVALQGSSAISVITTLSKEFPDLVEHKDADGRPAYATGTAEARRAMHVIYFCRRYKLSAALHKSATCAVVLANDMDDENERTVVIKFMLHKDQYEREVKAREQGLSAEFIVPILQTSDHEDVRNVWATDAAVHGFARYDNGIIMEFADRNMDYIMRQERPDLETARELLAMLVQALAHLESHELIHGDIKLLNIVRMKNTIKIIDMDAVAKLGGGYLGVKFSSGVLPPEMFAVLDGDGVKKYEAYWSDDFSSRSELWRKIEARWSKTGDAVVVKTWYTYIHIVIAIIGNLKSPVWFGRRADDTTANHGKLPYKREPTRVSHDIWSFGIVMFQLLCGAPLFQVPSLCLFLKFKRMFCLCF